MPVAAQQWYFTIDEYKDAERNALRGVRNVLVVNNALIQPADFGHSTVLDGKNQSGIEIALDRAPLYNMFSLTQFLDASGELTRVELLDQSQNSSTNYYQRMVLSQERARELIQTYEVDALLVLNQLVLYDVVEAFLTDEGGYYAYMQAFAQSHWNVYYSDHRPVKTITQADTLVWESDIENTRMQALNKLPNRQEALLYLATTVGEALGQSLVPSWEPARRYLYTADNIHVQNGLDAFRYQRWEEAIYHWQQVANDESNVESRKLKVKEDKKAAAVAAANIAIAYELLGDYALACDYASEASRLFGALKTAWARQQQVNIRYYLEQLRAKKAREAAR
jgi:tetratricopeptide (TPR) repeat protein